MTWHLDSDFVARYVEDRLTPAQSASVESHVMACADCRRRLTSVVDHGNLDDIWSSIADEIDQPRRNIAERILGRVGVRSHLARLVVLTPSLRLNWLMSVTAFMFLVALSTRGASAPGDRRLFVFLVLAPLLPLIGMAAAFGSRVDPAHELTTTAPISSVELLLARSLAVLVATTALTALAALALPAQGLSAMVWLLPALGLTTTALALTRWCSALAASVALGFAWSVASSLVLIGSTTRSNLVGDFAAFRPAGQVGFLVLTCIAAAVVLHQRDAFDLRRIS